MQLFVANKEQPPEITSILRTNRSKLLRFLKDFTTVEKGNKLTKIILYIYSKDQTPIILTVQTIRSSRPIKLRSSRRS